MNRTRGNNIRAGLFVLLAVLAAFAIVAWLGGLRESLTPRHEYIVRFDLETGAAGLDEGSQVNVGGRPVGRVKRIVLRPEPADGLPACVDVVVGIDRDIAFYGMPVGYLEKPLLGSGAEINFASVGSSDEGAPLPTTGEAVMRGAVAPPSFLAQAGYGEEQASQLQHILSRGESIATNLDESMRSVREEIVPDVKSISSSARDKWTGWSESIDGFATKLPEIADGTNARLEDLRQLIADARAVIADNRERIDSTIANIEAGSADARDFLDNANSRTKELLDGMLQDGRDALEDARTAIDRVDSLIAEQSPNLRKSVANARLATDQLRATLAEVRQAPWRLLYRPDTRELEFELLYDAARTYAEAVSDLRAAGESLEAASARQISSDEVARMLDEIKAAFGRYEGAERSLLQMLTETE